MLVNPLFAAGSDLIDVDLAGVTVDGMIHGDLHLGNILVDRGLKRKDEYWLIDFALAMTAPLGFDQAYLELSILIDRLEGVEPQRCAAVLDGRIIKLPDLSRHLQQGRRPVVLSGLGVLLLTVVPACWTLERGGSTGSAVVGM